MEPVRRQVSVGDRKAAYWEAGSSGDPIVYLHGFPTSGYLWRHVMAETGQSFRSLAPDLPGFGDSDLMDVAHTWDALVEWTGAFVDALGLDSVHLAVHDWGGLIGLAWACKNPDRVKSLLITDTSFRSTDKWHALARQWRTPGVGEEMLGSVTREGFEAMLSAVTRVGSDAMDEYFKGLKTAERAAAKLEMYRSLDFHMLEPLEGELSRVAPGRVRVIWGGNDPFVPAKIGSRFAEDLGAELTVFDDASHFLQEDRGAELGKLHREFLEDI